MNPRLIGDEMVDWSDLSGAHGPGPAGGAALAALLAVAHGRTLVVGPHDPSLIDSLAGEPTLLVRGVPDAEALATRYPDAIVYCGSPAKLGAERFDTVVALDGLARLSSVESAELTWGQAFDLLLGLLRPDGLLLLGAENPLGAHRLVALAPAPTDSDWAPASWYDPSRPGNLPDLLARMTDAGLAARGYAAFPNALAPATLLSTEMLAYGPRGVVEAAVNRSAATPRPALVDPRRLAVQAVRHGAAATLAAGWIVVARRGAEEPPAAPDAVVGDETIQRDGDRWLRGATELPVGPTLEYEITAAALRRDIPAVRELLRSWQAGPAAGVAAGQVIVGADGVLTALVEPGEPAEALAELAATLTYQPHPWPTPADGRELTGMLAAMAGGEIDPPSARTDAASYAEVVADRDRLARQLAEAHAKAEWYEETLDARDGALERAQRLVDQFSARGPARLGAALMAGARAARHTVRGLKRFTR